MRDFRKKPAADRAAMASKCKCNGMRSVAILNARTTKAKQNKAKRESFVFLGFGFARGRRSSPRLFVPTFSDTAPGHDPMSTAVPNGSARGCIIIHHVVILLLKPRS